jgi:uncharacterized protein (DUF1800 family)
VFTGHGIDNLGTSGGYLFRAAGHDTGTKEVFGLAFPAGGGAEEADRLLDHLALHPATARFVSRKLARRFVADDPPESVVDRCAQAWLRTGGDLREVMAALFGAAEFWAEAFRAGKVKTPYEFVIGAVRAVDGQVTASRGLAAALTAMGMPLFACNPPTGYSHRGLDWVNPSAHLARLNFSLDLAAGSVAGVSVDQRAALAALGAAPADPKAIASAFGRELLGRSFSDASADAVASSAASAGVSAATKAIGLCLAAPEMQVR